MSKCVSSSKIIKWLEVQIEFLRVSFLEDIYFFCLSAFWEMGKFSLGQGSQRVRMSFLRVPWQIKNIKNHQRGKRKNCAMNGPDPERARVPTIPRDVSWNCWYSAPPRIKCSQQQRKASATELAQSLFMKFFCSNDPSAICIATRSLSNLAVSVGKCLWLVPSHRNIRIASCIRPVVHLSVAHLSSGVRRRCKKPPVGSYGTPYPQEKVLPDPIN